MKKFIILLSSLMLIGCAVTQPGQSMEAEPYIAKFDYTPETQAAPNSSGVTFTVANGSYKTNSKDMPWFTYPQFADLGNGIKSDLSDILIAKGFNVRGPFGSYDLIPYSDKKHIDMLLVPQIEINIRIKDQKSQVENILAAPPVDILTGNVEVSGKVTVELREIATLVLMWAKSVPFEEFEFSYRIRNSPFYNKKHGIVFDLKPIIITDVAKGLESQYPKIMAAIASLIDAEEMNIIKKQCQEVRTEKMSNQGMQPTK
jgi:neuraminyllactose-binding hemagglutinin